MLTAMRESRRVIRDRAGLLGDIGEVFPPPPPRSPGPARALGSANMGAFAHGASSQAWDQPRPRQRSPGHGAPLHPDPARQADRAQRTWSPAGEPEDITGWGGHPWSLGTAAAPQAPPGWGTIQSQRALLRPMTTETAVTMSFLCGQSACLAGPEE